MVEYSDDGYPHLTDEERAEALKKKGLEFKAPQIETYENPKNLKGLKDIKKELAKVQGEAEYVNSLIFQTLRSKVGMRKVYTALIRVSPERIGKIMDYTFDSRKTIYKHLWSLVELGLARRIFCADVMRKKKLDEEEKEVKEKTDKWTSQMNDGMRRRFISITAFWVLTQLGKDKEILNFVLHVEKEFKKEIKEKK